MASQNPVVTTLIKLAAAAVVLPLALVLALPLIIFTLAYWSVRLPLGMLGFNMPTAPERHITTVRTGHRFTLH